MSRVEKLERRVWELEGQIVTRLNIEEVNERFGGRIAVAWDLAGPEIWEMTLNTRREWPGARVQPEGETTLDDLLECYASLRHPRLRALRESAKTPGQFNRRTESYIARHRGTLLNEFIGAMETALKGLNP